MGSEENNQEVRFERAKAGSSEETANTMKTAIMETINLKATSLDEEVEAQEAGLIQVIGTLKQGWTSNPA